MFSCTTVLLAFDNLYDDAFDYQFPYLYTRGIPATLFFNDKQTLPRTYLNNVAELYYTYILHGIYELLNKNGLMTQYQQAFVETKKRNNPKFTYDPSNEDDQNKFTSWLHSRKEFKEAAKARTAKFVSADVIDSE